MRIAVRYQSKGGNTKAVAEIIAKAAGVTAESIDVPISEQIDLLFAGGGVYAWGIDPSLKEFLENLNPQLVSTIAAFTTAGGMDKTKAAASVAKSRGIKVCAEALAVKLGVRNHALLGGKGNITLTDKQVSDVRAFVEKAVKSVENQVKTGV